MEEIKEMVLRANLIRGKEKIGTVEKELFLIEDEESFAEVGQAKGLSDIVDCISESIDMECKGKNVKIADRTKLSFNIILALVDGTEGTVTVDVPVVDAEKNEERGKEDEQNE